MASSFVHLFCCNYDPKINFSDRDYVSVKVARPLTVSIKFKRDIEVIKDWLLFELASRSNRGTVDFGISALASFFESQSLLLAY